MENLVARLSQDFPKLEFCSSNSFYWSPKTGQIFYSSEATSKKALWSLLHETAHALLGHKNYSTDMQLLTLEMNTWEKSKFLGKKYGISITNDHIERCLDSYRDWLYKRSVCPKCLTSTAQLDNGTSYTCYNCRHSWRVSRSRFCRTYRENLETKKAFPDMIVSESL